MAVKTYSLNKPFAQDRDPHPCEFCEQSKEATYWSQNEAGYKPLGPSVFHCQRHRVEARTEATKGYGQ